MSDATDRRQQAERAGHRAERRAALYLTLRGYRIVSRNLRTPVSEIDLLALRRGALILIEVKARNSLAACEDSLNWTTRRRLDRAAEWLIANSAWGTDRKGRARDIRIDALFVIGRKIRHLKDAWRAGE